jgi:hypothetical protein
MKYFLIIAFVFFSACSTVQSENEGALKKAEKKTIGILMGKTMTKRQWKKQIFQKQK